MPLDFTPISIGKSTVRKFAAPITSANTFDAAVVELKAEYNPLGATVYQTVGESIDGVTTTGEYYKATIEYVDPLGETLGTITIDAPTRTAYDDIIAEILSATTITTSSRNTAKDSGNVRLKIHNPSGELYYLSFTRKDLKISSYEADAILTKVDTWADDVAAINWPTRFASNAR